MPDKLGEYFKVLEDEYETRLPTQTPVIMRLDGKAFHTYTRGFEKPFSDRIHEAMVEAAAVLCKEIQNARFAYTQSDEISILIYEPTDKAQTWFGNRVQKMCSVAGSVCSNIFNNKLREVAEADNKDLSLAAFDVRVFSCPKDKVEEYFHWRQQDAIRNSVSALAQAHFSHRKLNKKKRRDMLIMLEDNGIQWDNCEDWQKYGSTIVKMWREKKGPNGEVVHRSYWGKMDQCVKFFKIYECISTEFTESVLKQEVTSA